MPPLTTIARQIAAARTTPPAPTSQSSSFVALRASQAGSTSDLAGRAAPRPRHPSPSPSRSHSSRSSSRAEHAGEVLLQMFARLSEQLTAQFSAQSTALTTVMQRFDTLHSATPPRRSRRSGRQEITASRSPSRRASPTLPSQRPSHRQSALEVDALQGSPLLSAARPLAQDPRATAHQLALSARVSCAAGSGSAVAPAGPSPTRSFRVAYIAHVARIACASVADTVHKCGGEPTVGAPACAARSPVAVSRAAVLASFAYTIRSTVFAERTARRKYSGGAG